MAIKDERIEVRINKIQKTYLEYISKEKGLSISELVREYICEGLYIDNDILKSAGINSGEKKEGQI